MDLLSIGIDRVHINGLKFETIIGLDAWHRPNKTQPIELDVQITPQSTSTVGGLEQAAQEDSVAYTVDYGKLYKKLLSLFGPDLRYNGVCQLYQSVKSCLPQARSWQISITLPKAILAARKGVQFKWNGNTEENNVSVLQIMTISDIECRCIIGVNPHERLEKQRLYITITIASMENRLRPSLLAGVSLDPSPTLVYQVMVQSVVERVEASSYETIEALATAICQLVTMNFDYDNARVTIDKPGGIAGSGVAGVSIGRTKAYFENKDFWKIKRP